MNGSFDLTLVNNRGLNDDYFQRATEEGWVMDLVNDLPVERKLTNQQNWIFDNMAGAYMRHALSGPALATNWDALYGAAGQGWLGWIQLTTTNALPTYTEDFTYNNTQITMSSATHDADTANATTSAKRFVEDQITAATNWSDATREAIYSRHRWLWTPAQGASNSIKSITLHTTYDCATTTPQASGKIGRVRLRDAAGLPATLVKTASNSLFVEYTYSLVAM